MRKPLLSFLLALLLPLGVRSQAPAADTLRRIQGTPAQYLLLGDTLVIRTKQYDLEALDLRSFQQVALPSAPDSIRDITHSPAGALYALSTKGRVWKYEGGRWRNVPLGKLPLNRRYYQLIVVDDQTLLLGSFGEVYLSTTGKSYFPSPAYKKRPQRAWSYYIGDHWPGFSTYYIDTTARCIWLGVRQGEWGGGVFRFHYGSRKGFDNPAPLNLGVVDMLPLPDGRFSALLQVNHRGMHSEYVRLVADTLQHNVLIKDFSLPELVNGKVVTPQRSPPFDSLAHNWYGAGYRPGTDSLLLVTDKGLYYGRFTGNNPLEELGQLKLILPTHILKFTGSVMWLPGTLRFFVPTERHGLLYYQNGRLTFLR